MRYGEQVTYQPNVELSLVAVTGPLKVYHWPVFLL
jgi:hypothetical protein